MGCYAFPPVPIPPAHSLCVAPWHLQKGLVAAETMIHSECGLSGTKHKNKDERADTNMLCRSPSVSYSPTG
ncbi:hypothetical protein NW752_005416 [Fusarium irregulare]|nr:hypothetical protein NW752_005416 [Fusarium irregulare]